MNSTVTITYGTYHAVTRLYLSYSTAPASFTDSVLISAGVHENEALAEQLTPVSWVETSPLRLRLKTSSLKRVYSLSLCCIASAKSKNKKNAKVLPQEATATFRGDVGHKRVKAPTN